MTLETAPKYWPQIFPQRSVPDLRLSQNYALPHLARLSTSLCYYTQVIIKVNMFDANTVLGTQQSTNFFWGSLNKSKTS